MDTTSKEKTYPQKLGTVGCCIITCTFCRFLEEKLASSQRDHHKYTLFSLLRHHDLPLRRHCPLSKSKPSLYVLGIWCWSFPRKARQIGFQAVTFCICIGNVDLCILILTFFFFFFSPEQGRSNLSKTE